MTTPEFDFPAHLRLWLGERRGCAVSNLLLSISHFEHSNLVDYWSVAEPIQFHCGMLWIIDEILFRMRYKELDVRGYVDLVFSVIHEWVERYPEAAQHLSDHMAAKLRPYLPDNTTLCRTTRVLSYSYSLFEVEHE